MNRIVFRHGMTTSLVLLLVVTMFAAQNQRPSSALPTAPFAGAAISDWVGRIQLQLPGQPPSSPARGQVLPPGTALDTADGRLLLRLDDGSQILVRAHTRLLLKQPAAGDWNYLELLLGRIRAQIRKRTGGAPPFQLGTPSAVIAVRGTRFDVEVNPHNVTEVDVFEGLVEVSGRHVPGPSVLLEPGFSTRVGMDTAPEPPRPTEEIRPEVERPDQEMESEHERDSRVEGREGKSQEMEEGQEPSSPSEESDPTKPESSEDDTKPPCCTNYP